MTVAYGIYHAIGFVGPNPLAMLAGFAIGAWKATKHFLLGLSIWTIVFFIIKGITWILLILSIDILTPPYGIDIETIFALPLGSYLKTALDLSLGWAIGLAYAVVFGLALAYLALWWYVLRKLPV